MNKLIEFILSLFKIETKPLTFEERVIRALTRKNYTVDKGSGEVNIVYIEGMSTDLLPNKNEPNKFNDLRMVIQFEGGIPVIKGKWEATTEPGRHFVESPINPGGAARIEFGQYRAWQVGMHRDNHEALVQTGGPVTVCRDLNEDYKREGDKKDTGYFGINQHWGYDNPIDDIGTASAGCLVGRTKKGHVEFMALVKSEPRYKANKSFIFSTSVLQASEVA